MAKLYKAEMIQKKHMDSKERKQMLKENIKILKDLKSIVNDATLMFKESGSTQENKVNAVYKVLASTLHPDSIKYMNELNRDLYVYGNGKREILFDTYNDSTERLDSLLSRYKHQHMGSEMSLPDLNSISNDFQKLIDYVEAKV